MCYLKKNSTCFVNNVFHINQSLFNNKRHGQFLSEKYFYLMMYAMKLKKLENVYFVNINRVP